MSLTGRVTPPKPPSEREPYSPPRITRYGHIKDIVKGTGGGGNDGGANHSKVCWVAEALYGASAPRTTLVRTWLSQMGAETRRWRLFVALYRLIGPGLATLIRRRRIPATPFLRLFDVLVMKAGDESLRTLKGR